MRGEGKLMRKITAHWRRLGEKFAVILITSMKNCVLLVSNQPAAAFFDGRSMGLL